MTGHAGRPLPRSTPAAEGVDAAGVLALVDALGAEPGVEPHGLMLLRHGKVVAEGWWAPYAPHRPQLVYSLSKSFTSAAAGLAFGDGLIDLDAPVLRYFPELDAEITDRRARAIRVRHVASMASGHLSDTVERALAVDREHLVRGFLSLPVDREPGTVFAYNQPATYTLGTIVQRVTGKTLTQYLRPRLFEPLGIADAFWRQFPEGHDLAFSGLHTTVDAIARLGQLHLAGGVWEGRRLLPAEWVAEATRPHVATAGPAPDLGSDWAQGYGFQCWMSRHGYRGDGAYGQYMLVLPEHDAVLALTSDTEDMQRVLDLVWQHLLPAFDSAPAAGAGAAGGSASGSAAAGSASDSAAGGDAGGDVAVADRELAARLEALALPPGEAAGAGPGPDWPDEAHFTRAGTGPDDGADAEAGRAFFAVGDSPRDQPKLTAARVARGADGAWTLTLIEDGRPLDLRFGGAGWTVDAADDARARADADGVAGPGADAGPSRPPTAVSAGWTDPDTLVADVIFLETPHHLLVTCSRRTGTFTVRWRTRPLHLGRLVSYRAPRP
jgi:CubicO group peptidase (beta-lactamase class C family)